jgi:hypothetical protein
VDFSIKLARAAAAMTWATLVIAVTAVLLMDRFGAPEGVTIHLWAYLGWTVLGIAVSLFLTFLPELADRSAYVQLNQRSFRALLLISDTVWVTGGAAVTGGSRARSGSATSASCCSRPPRCRPGRRPCSGWRAAPGWWSRPCTPISWTRPPSAAWCWSAPCSR